jgi:uncharacterized protein DUF4062
LSLQLTVFICSTYSDLSSEREAVLEAVRRLKLQHDSMEFFGARDERPVETCLEEVRKSDVLVVIVGHLYGTLVSELSVSFSEAEYAEGVRLKKPCLIYVRDENVPVLPRYFEHDPEKLRLLGRWKATLRDRHTIVTFKGSRDLAAQVTADLKRIIRRVSEEAEAQEQARPRHVITRRDILKTLRDASLGAFAVKMFDNVWVTVPDLAEEPPSYADRQLLESLINTSRSVQIFAGETNKLGALTGKVGRSYFLATAAAKFGAFLKGALGINNFQESDADDPVFSLRFTENDLLLLGGPVSNDVAACVTGHSFIEIETGGKLTRLPVFRGYPGLRWGFYCGDTGFGMSQGVYRSARRFDRGEEVERPLYGVVDLNDGKQPSLFPAGSDSFLREEALLIGRLRNPFDPNRFVTTLGGVHGYSTLAFVGDLSKNLDQLTHLIKGCEQYQVLVPVVLDHQESLRETFGTLLWRNAQLHRIH